MTAPVCHENNEAAVEMASLAAARQTAWPLPAPVRSIAASTEEDPMEVLDWFHPRLTRHAAECMLIDNGPEGSYLLRPSSNGEGYAISVKLSSSVQHVRVTITPGGRYVFGNSSFGDVRSFRRHFSLEKPVIGGDSGIRVTLKYPYPRYIEEGHLYTELVHHAVSRMVEYSDDDSDSGTQDGQWSPLDSRMMGVSSKEGYLTKQGFIRKSWRVRWFVLRNNSLSYYKTKQHKSPISTLDLKKATSVELDNSKWKEFCFRLVFPRRTYFFLGNSIEDCQQWIELLHLKISANESVE